MTEIYLSFNNMAEVLKLPVNPEKLEITRESNNKSFFLANFGEVTMTDRPKAAQVVIESFFPDGGSSFGKIGDVVYSPKECVEKLGSWRNSLKPMRLTVTGNAKPLSLACTIEGFDYWEAAGACGDIYFRLKLKEYRFFKMKQLGGGSVGSKTTGGAVKGVVKTGGRANEGSGGSRYTVKKGDSLWSICQRFLGDGSKYKAVAKLNGLSNPNLIRVGQVIRLK